jgi:hypothetical protein
VYIGLRAGLVGKKGCGLQQLDVDQTGIRVSVTVGFVAVFSVWVRVKDELTRFCAVCMDKIRIVHHQEGGQRQQ